MEARDGGGGWGLKVAPGGEGREKGLEVGMQEVKLLLEIGICVLSMLFMLDTNLDARHKVPR